MVGYRTEQYFKLEGQNYLTKHFLGDWNVFLFYPIVFLIRMTLILLSRFYICWGTGWYPLFTTILIYVSYVSRDLIL